MCEAGKERLQWQDGVGNIQVRNILFYSGEKYFGVGNIQVRNILAKKILRVGKYSVGQALS